MKIKNPLFLLILITFIIFFISVNLKVEIINIMQVKYINKMLIITIVLKNILYLGIFQLLNIYIFYRLHKIIG